MEEEKFYSVREVADILSVEPYILRYYEKELNLTIKRNSKSHRVYTEDDINLMRQIFDLRDKGLQLKAIEAIVKEKETEDTYAELSSTSLAVENDEMSANITHISDLREQRDQKIKETVNAETKDSLNAEVQDSMNLESQESTTLKVKEATSLEPAKSRSLFAEDVNITNLEDDKVKQFSFLMKEMFKQAITECGEETRLEMHRTIKEEVDIAVEEKVNQIQEKHDSKNEAYYKKLDETMREVQRMQKEINDTKREIEEMEQQRAKKGRTLFGKLFGSK